jgi:hypothetical protein
MLDYKQKLLRQISQQNLELEQNKARIKSLQSQIQAFDIERINAVESEYRNLAREIENMEREKEDLLGIKQVQAEALTSGEGHAGQLLQGHREEQELVNELKLRKEAIYRKEKQLRLLHEECVDKEKRLSKRRSKARTQRHNKTTVESSFA